VSLTRERGEAMNEIFPPPVKAASRGGDSHPGVEAYLSQSDTHQILFMNLRRMPGWRSTATRASGESSSKGESS